MAESSGRDWSVSEVEDGQPARRGWWRPQGSHASCGRSAPRIENDALVWRGSGSLPSAGRGGRGRGEQNVVVGNDRVDAFGDGGPHPPGPGGQRQPPALRSPPHTESARI